jgi:hypothetical protein
MLSISTFHGISKTTKTVHGVHVRDYYFSMVGAYPKLQPFLIERKRGLKWYIKLFNSY